jgi:hypothetical protein
LADSQHPLTQGLIGLVARRLRSKASVQSTGGLSHNRYGERCEANFVKVAVTVVRRSGSDNDDLPAVLHG